MRDELDEEDIMHQMSNLVLSADVGYSFLPVSAVETTTASTVQAKPVNLGRESKMKKLAISSTVQNFLAVRQPESSLMQPDVTELEAMTFEEPDYPMTFEDESRILSKSKLDVSGFDVDVSRDLLNYEKEAKKRSSDTY